MVVRHCAVGIERRDGGEAQADEVRTARPRSRQLHIDIDLAHHFASLGGLEPRKELAQRGAILLHGPSDMRQIGITLARFGQGRGIDAFHQPHTLAQMGQQATGDLGRIQQQATAGGYCTEPGGNRRLNAR